jgi:adenosylmethionine-8-amino-7-oxononanoate aminotransferase
VELVKDKATKQTFSDQERRPLLTRVSSALLAAGLYCRTDDRGDSVIQLAPPLISGQAEFDTIESILRGVLHEESARL